MECLWCLGPVASPGIVLLGEDRGGLLRDPFSCRVTFLQVCFLMLFLLPLFAIFAPKSLPKWSPNPSKIDEKMVSVAISKKVPKNAAEI